VSLCQTAMMIYRNGKLEDGLSPEELSPDEIAALSFETNTHLGRAKHLSPILQMSETPPFWALPTPKLGANTAEWMSA